MLIVLMRHMTYFCSTSHFMVMSVATKINFLGLENFCMLYIVSTLPLHTDRFDVQHDLLQDYFTLHDHERGHQDPLLVIEVEASNKGQLVEIAGRILVNT